VLLLAKCFCQYDHRITPQRLIAHAVYTGIRVRAGIIGGQQRARQREDDPLLRGSNAQLCIVVQKIEPAHARHVDVEKDQLWQRAPRIEIGVEQIQRLLSVARHINRQRTTRLCDHTSVNNLCNGIVVDQQYPVQSDHSRIPSF